MELIKLLLVHGIYKINGAYKSEDYV